MSAYVVGPLASHIAAATENRPCGREHAIEAAEFHAEGALADLAAGHVCAAVGSLWLAEARRRESLVAS